MMKSIDPGLRSIVQRALKSNPLLQLQAGRRHLRVVHRRSGDFVVVSGSSGDWRCGRNLTTALKRLSENGAGLIAARQRKPHARVVQTESAQ